MFEKVRGIAAFTVLLFAIELLTPPCGTACHRTQAEPTDTQTSNTAEHSCHEAPAQEGVAQIAGVPSACTHQHDLPDSSRTSTTGDRNQHVTIPPIVLLPSHGGILHLQSVLSPHDRQSIRIPSLTLSLRI